MSKKLSELIDIRLDSGKSGGTSWKWLQARIQAGELNLNPDYQRGRVWPPEQSSEFIGFCLEGGKCAPLFIQNNGDEDKSGYEAEIVDGKQRTCSVLSFLSNEIPAKFHNGQQVYFKEFTPEDQGYIRSFHFTTMEMTLPNKIAVMEFYLRLNSCRVEHTTEELDKVRDMISRYGQSYE